MIQPISKVEKKEIKSFYHKPPIPIWVIGVIIGLVLGVATVFIDKYMSFAANQSIATGLIIGLLVSLVGILIDTRASLEERRDVEDYRARLMNALEECSLYENDLLELLWEAARIRTKNVHITNKAKQIIDVCTERLREVSGFQVINKGYDLDILIELIDEAKNIIYATSTAVDFQLWQKKDGDKYLSKQQEAVKRGIKIQRLFVLTDEIEENKTHMKFISNVMNQQLKNKIEVKWIRDSTLDALLVNSGLYFEDFVIIDDYAMVETQARNRQVKGMKINFNQITIQDRAKQYNIWWKNAMEVEELSIPSL